MRAWYSSSPTQTLCTPPGSPASSTFVAWSVMKRVPKRSAWSRKVLHHLRAHDRPAGSRGSSRRRSSAGAGRPRAKPSMTSGLRFARDVYSAAVYPAGPLPTMMTFSISAIARSLFRSHFTLYSTRPGRRRYTPGGGGASSPRAPPPAGDRLAQRQDRRSPPGSWAARTRSPGRRGRRRSRSRCSRRRPAKAPIMPPSTPPIPPGQRQRGWRSSRRSRPSRSRRSPAGPGRTRGSTPTATPMSKNHHITAPSTPDRRSRTSMMARAHAATRSTPAPSPGAAPSARAACADARASSARRAARSPRARARWRGRSRSATAGEDCRAPP